MTPITRFNGQARLRCSEICCTTVEAFPISTSTPAIEAWAERNRWASYVRCGERRFVCVKCLAGKRRAA